MAPSTDHLGVLLHEAAHATVAAILGLKLLRVRADCTGYPRGIVEWIPGDPIADAAVKMAPQVVGLGGCGVDEHEALALVSGIDYSDARSLARSILLSPGGKAARYALVDALITAPDNTMSGPVVERIVWEAYVA